MAMSKMCPVIFLYIIVYINYNQPFICKLEDTVLFVGILL